MPERSLPNLLGKAGVVAAVLIGASWGASAWGWSLQPPARPAAQHLATEQLRFRATQAYDLSIKPEFGESIRLESGFEAQLDVPEPLRIIALYHPISTAKLVDGRFLRWTFEKNNHRSGNVTSMTLAWTLKEAGVDGVRRPTDRPPKVRPSVPGHRFVSATPAYLPGGRYNFLGLLHATVERRTLVVAFSDVDGSHSRLMSVRGQFSAVSSMPDAHGASAAVVIVSSPTPQSPMRLLVYHWFLDGSPALRR